MHFNNNILLHAIPGFLLLIAAEILYMRKEHHHSTEKKNEILASIGIGLGATIVSFFTNGLIVFIYSIIYQYHIFNLSVSYWWVWIICFLGDDLSWYWFHRLSHQIRFLWASHAVHHSPETFCLSGGMRVPWTSNFTGNFLFWAWMPLIGIEPGMVMLMKSIEVIYQFWLHTEAINKMPKWFETVFNTPSHHRVHHGSNIEYLDKNHGGYLIIWDKIFGTYQEEIFKPKYGLTEDIKSFNPVVIAFHEWKNILRDLKRSKKIKDRLSYFFKAPGWSHDGTGKTTKQLQSELKVYNKAKLGLIHNKI